MVKLYALSLDALMEEERGLITHVIDAQEAYHRENGTYACALELLAGMEKTRRGLHAANGGRAQRRFHLHPEREPRSGL